MAFARFMASGAGRSLRVVAGLALIGLGLGAVGGVGGWILAAVGLAPLFSGVFNVCLLAPLLPVPFRGADVLRGHPRAGVVSR